MICACAVKPLSMSLGISSCVDPETVSALTTVVKCHALEPSHLAAQPSPETKHKMVWHCGTSSVCCKVMHPTRARFVMVCDAIQVEESNNGSKFPVISGSGKVQSSTAQRRQGTATHPHTHTRATSFPLFARIKAKQGARPVFMVSDTSTRPSFDVQTFDRTTSTTTLG